MHDNRVAIACGLHGRDGERLRTRDACEEESTMAKGQMRSNKEKKKPKKDKAAAKPAPSPYSSKGPMTGGAKKK
jgi:hypothetical protein